MNTYIQWFHQCYWYMHYLLSSSGSWRQSPPVPVAWLLFSAHIRQSVHQTWERGSNRREERGREREREEGGELHDWTSHHFVLPGVHTSHPKVGKLRCYINLEKLLLSLHIKRRDQDLQCEEFRVDSYTSRRWSGIALQSVVSSWYSHVHYNIGFSHVHDCNNSWSVHVPADFLK